MGQEESYPSIPDELDVIKAKGLDLTEIPFKIDPDNKLVLIDFSENKLKSFPLSQNHVEEINISSNPIQKLLDENKDITISYPALRCLKMENCELRNYPDILNSCVKLEKLKLKRNYIESLNITLPQIRKLDLFINCLTELRTLPPSLEKLNVGFNNLRSLQFSHQKLTELNLSGNTITEVSTDITFPSLIVLNLSHNHIFEIASIKKLCPKVEKIHMTANFLTTPLTDIPNTIQHIDVSYNSIEEWPESLAELINLKYFNVSYNELKNLPILPTSIQTLITHHNKFTNIAPIENTFIKKFNFRACELTELPDLSKTKSVFISVRNNQLKSMKHSNRISKYIKMIDYSFNLLTNVNPSFLKFKHLKSLSLVCNQIKHLPNEIANTKIESLMLSENPINYIHELPPTLTKLSCAGCNFTYIPSCVYSLEKLELLDFSCNEISEIKPIRAKQLILCCNKITSLPPLDDPLTTLLIAHNELTDLQFSPSITMLENLDISHNKIATLNVTKCENLKVLKLSSNPLKCEIDIDTLFPNLETFDIVATALRPKYSPEKRFHELAQDRARDYDKKSNGSVKYFQPKLDSGYFEFIGARPTMEDALILRDVPGGRMVGILDGHGGSRTATIGAYFIPTYYERNTEYGITTINEILEQMTWLLKKENVRDGCTMALTLISDLEIACAHLGDTRALIVHKDATVHEITCDHKATDRMEFDLLKEKRCFLSLGRVNGSLAVSRAIGDFQIDGLLRQPTIQTVQRSPNDLRLLLACDGVFDVMSNEDVGKIVAGEPDPARAAAKVVCLAYARGSTDNISAVVVNIDMPPAKPKFSLFKRK